MSDLTTEPTRPIQGATAGPEALRLDLQLCFALYSASNQITRLYRPLLAPLGLTYPQYLAMMVLWERAPRTVSELGQALRLDSGTLTPLLKRLEASGLVDRARDPHDERRVQVGLTPAGEALKARAAHVPAALVCQLGADLDEFVGLREKLQSLSRRMDAAE